MYKMIDDTKLICSPQNTLKVPANPSESAPLIQTVCTNSDAAVVRRNETSLHTRVNDILMATLKEIQYNGTAYTHCGDTIQNR